MSEDAVTWSPKGAVEAFGRLLADAFPGAKSLRIDVTKELSFTGPGKVIIEIEEVK